MTTISGLGSAGSAWSGVAGARSTQMRDKMFARVDSDGSGNVDKTELQSMLDHISQKSGISLGNADDLFSSMDTDGNGSLTEDELDQGMKSLMPPPSSTMDFAQQRTAAASGSGRPERPPRCDGPPPGNAASSATSSSSDPLDTNGDGTVSAQERMAGDIKALLAQADTDGNSTLSKAESSAFAEKLASLFSPQSSEAALSVTA